MATSQQAAKDLSLRCGTPATSAAASNDLLSHLSLDSAEGGVDEGLVPASQGGCNTEMGGKHPCRLVSCLSPGSPPFSSAPCAGTILKSSLGDGDFPRVERRPPVNRQGQRRRSMSCYEDANSLMCYQGCSSDFALPELLHSTSVQPRGTGPLRPHMGSARYEEGWRTFDRSGSFSTNSSSSSSPARLTAGWVDPNELLIDLSKSPRLQRRLSQSMQVCASEADRQSKGVLRAQRSQRLKTLLSELASSQS